MYLIIITLTKVSILFFYLRIFPNPRFRQVCYMVMAWVSITGLIFLLLQIFQCIPVDYVWNGWTGTYGPHICLDVNTQVYAAAGFSIVQDFVILALPLPLIAKLKASWKAKLGIMVMFSLGIFVIIMSCIRLGSMIYFARSLNPTWDYTDVLIWTGLEAAVSIIVVSLPAIRVLVTRECPRLLAAIKSRGGRKGSPSTGNGSKLWKPSGYSYDISGRGFSSMPSESQNRRHDRGLGSSSTHVICGGDRDGDWEYELELGDRRRGDVRTEIGVSTRRKNGLPVEEENEVSPPESHTAAQPSGTLIHVRTLTSSIVARKD